ncbi:protein kinase [Kitasatospora sp. NPDC056531]|uniref:serine/threonine-protein kinase n=1 Tax=Kitasatospora sp. NPDC056531 TaxID=3345856 RepID=UPI0036A1988E
MRDQLLGDRYRLVRQLGEGGMGQVWEAQDETLGRNVAVKVISLLAGGGSRGGEARARFLREARITAQLQHPNIVTIHDLGEMGAGDERVPFLVMELVRGEGLDTMLRRGVVTLADAARWGAQISDALAVAHAAGIMHRDIKPSNILITPSGTVKVLDFGIARAVDPYATADRLTQDGFIVGTPPYMAPEQARGFPEPRSDLYALGCLLFELITGRLPFQAPDTVGYLTAHLTQEPPTPSSVSTGVPSAWDELVLKLLEKDPDQRYPNATDLSQELRHLDRTPEPAQGPAPPAGGATQPSSTTATAPLPPVAPTRRASGLPPRPDTASTHTPARRGRATRFVLPVCLWLLLVASLVGPPALGILVELAVTWVFTAVLTPRSFRLTRGTGYTAVAALAVQLVTALIHWENLDLPDSWPYLTMIILTIPAYCYREIKTRRAASSGPTPRTATSVRQRLTRLRTVSAGRDIMPPDDRPPTKDLPTEVLAPPSRSVLKRRTAVAVVAPILLAAVAAFPYVLSQGRGTPGQQPSQASSPTTPSTTPSASPPLSLSPPPSASPTQTVTVRYNSIPKICDKVGSRSGAIIPDMDAGEEDATAIGASLFTGIAESHGCRWSTEGYWSDHPWAADVDVTMFRFSSGAYGSAAFDKERTSSFYGNAPRLHDFADDLCMSNPTGKDYGYAHVMFRIDNLLVQVSYEMLTKTGSPAPAVARPRGLDMAKYVYEVLTASS